MKFLGNLGTFEDLTNSPDIIVNEKIGYRKFYKLGNIVFGFFLVKDGSVFEYAEKIITFPFKSKTEYRDFTKTGKKDFTYIIWNNKNSIEYLTPNGIAIGNNIGNFYFVI